MVCQRISSDVVRLHERGVKEIAQIDSVAGLEADVVFGYANECFGWDRRDLVQITAAMLGPIEHNHGRGDFRETANLALLGRLLGIEDSAGCRIDNDISLRPGGRTAAARERNKQGKANGKTLQTFHDSLERVDVNHGRGRCNPSESCKETLRSNTPLSAALLGF